MTNEAEWKVAESLGLYFSVLALVSSSFPLCSPPLQLLGNALPAPELVPLVPVPLVALPLDVPLLELPLVLLVPLLLELDPTLTVPTLVPVPPVPAMKYCRRSATVWSSTLRSQM